MNNVNGIQKKTYKCKKKKQEKISEKHHKVDATFGKELSMQNEVDDISRFPFLVLARHKLWST